MLKLNLMLTSIIASMNLWAAESAKNQNTLANYLQQGGWIMQVLLLLSIVVVALVIYYLLILRDKNVGTTVFVQQIEEAIESKKQLDVVEEFCKQEDVVLSLIVLSIIKEKQKNKADDFIRESCNEKVSKFAEMIMGRLDYLNDIAEIAPIFGLLGTVMGMMMAFGNTQVNLEGLQIDSLATGVTQALVTTAAGLIIAVIAKILYSIFKIKAIALIDRLEKKADVVVDLILLHSK